MGHAYPGKRGQSLGGIWTFLSMHASVTVILAHLGGGLPFYAFMPEVAALFRRTYVDTAATPWLYAPGVYRAVAGLIGAERILFASDFPLRHPRADLGILRDAGLNGAALAAILGENAARLFGLRTEST